jgi:DNA (cytosine-5)-methyltransferase 1
MSEKLEDRILKLLTSLLEGTHAKISPPQAVARAYVEHSQAAPIKVLLEPEGCPRDSAEGCGEEGHKVIGSFTSSVRKSDIADTLLARYAKSPATAGRDSSVRNVVLDPTGRVRRLTPLECERLQGFPDGWTCLCEAQGNTERCRCPDSPRYRALGNAVAVPVVEWIAKRILKYEQGLL